MNNKNIKEKIDKDFCFNSSVISSIKKYNEALHLFNSLYDKARQLTDDFDIFLDTSVLIDYYQISFSERTDFKKIIENYKSRIFLTSQIEKEFLSIRVGKIKNFNKRLNISILQNFNAVETELQKLRDGKINSLDIYINDKVIKNDYKQLYESLNNLYKEMSNKLKELFSNEKFSEEIRETQKEVKDKIRKATSDNNKLEKVDDILELFSEFKVTDNLDEKEIDFLHSKYKELKSKYDEIKSDQNKNWQFTFPGCGENKDKIDPTSDFVIVNEIMKHMKNEQRNAVFLTTDTTKNDWLNEQKEHYTHYISEFYSNTGKMLFIFDAKNILKMDFENIYKITERNNEQKPDMANNLNKAISNNQLSALEKNVIACIVNSQEQINKSPYTVNINKYLCTIGYNQIEINVAILGLVKKEFIKIWYNEEYEDSNGYYKVLQNAKDWILENQEELFEIVRKQIEAYDMIDRSGEYD